MNTRIGVKLLTFLLHTLQLFRGKADINTQAFKKIKIFSSDLNTSYQNNRNDGNASTVTRCCQFFFCQILNVLNETV